MVITSIFNKSTLEIFLQKKYNIFGKLFINIFLDSLKNLGYFFSTFSGTSIGDTDLKMYYFKNLILKSSLFNVKNLEFNWQNGKISEIEKYQYINSLWENISGYIKDTLLSYYKNNNSLNILYIMAFSGARGNISQIRQMVGIRGLMINQYGDLISIPVLNNFKEGLSFVDFIISSYGARKGVIDTALKTAEAGYLTRKLIYLIQDIIIKDTNCFSKNSILITTKDDLLLNIFGKTFIALKYKNFIFKNIKNLILTEKIIDYFIENIEFINYIQIRSPITCNLKTSICQTCYGWDLTKKKKICLGDAIGILTAHTIGEPGTQMTMRTFHIGGVFLGENLKYFIAKNTGKIKFLMNINQNLIQNKFGKNLYYLVNNHQIYFTNWQNNLFFLYSSSFMYKYLFNFIQKGDPIFEENISFFSVFLTKNLYFRPIYSQIYGYLIILKNYKKYNIIKDNFFKYFLTKNFIKLKNLMLTRFDNYCYQNKGYFFLLPLNIKCHFYKNIKIFQFKTKINLFKFNFLNLKKSIGKLKIISKGYGIILKKKNIIFVKKKILKFKTLKLIIKNIYLMIFVFYLSKIQYIDKKTNISNIYIFF